LQKLSCFFAVSFCRAGGEPFLGLAAKAKFDARIMPGAGNSAGDQDHFLQGKVGRGLQLPAEVLFQPLPLKETAKWLSPSKGEVICARVALRCFTGKVAPARPWKIKPRRPVMAASGIQT
jgi:hypothetical protein